MKHQTLLNLLLAVALLVVSFQLIRQKQQSDPMPSNTSEVVVNNIFSRTSIRQFTPTPVPASAIDTLLRAAMSAPTARNQQPWHFVVVQDTAQISALRNTSRHSGPLSTATLAIAVCGNLDKALEGEAQPYWIQDTSAATENLLLAAHAIGLGAVWTGVYPIQERVDAVSEVLQLPKQIVPMAVVALGYPAEQPQPKDKWLEENISWNSFDQKKD